MGKGPEKYLTTSEIARYLHLNEKKIYVLAAKGEIPSVRISGKWLFPLDIIEKYMRDKTHYPGEGIMEKLLPNIFIIEGSDDFLFKEIVYSAGKLTSYPVTFGVLGSAGGMDLMSKHQIHAATVHFLVDREKGRIPHIKEDHYLIDLFTRQQGFIFCKKAPGTIKSVSDVVSRNLKIAVREKSCGTFHLTQMLFEKEGLKIDEYPHKTGPYLTHREAAGAVASTRADVAVGIRRAADHPSLDFIPILEEDFYLMLPAKYMGEKKVVSFIDALLDRLRNADEDLKSGYDLLKTGRISAVTGRGDL